MNLPRLLTVPAAGLCLAVSVQAQGLLVHWESPHVHPLELTPGGRRLLAVELDAGSDPADAASVPGGCAEVAPSAPTGLAAIDGRADGALTWNDTSSNESTTLPCARASAKK